MILRPAVLLAALVLVQSGCVTSALRGARDATISGLRLEERGDPPSIVTRSVPHTFVLTNVSGDPVTIVDARVAIGTTVSFADGTWSLPRVIEPRETFGILVTAKVRAADHVSWVELVLDAGETIRLELRVDAEIGPPRSVAPITLVPTGRGDGHDA